MNLWKLHTSTKLVLWCLLLMALTSCVEEFETDSIKFEQLLVVDGNISDQVKQHAIHLNYTIPMDGNLAQQNAPATGASVWVEDNLGNKTYFTELEPGSYYSPNDFGGVIGRSYQLFISTAEGKNYQTPPQEMMSAPEISNIYNRFSIELGDGESTYYPGVQFFVDVADAASSTQFYRYEWNDAHQVTARYTKNLDAVLQTNGSYKVVPFTLNVKECYRESRFNKIILATSTNSSNGELLEVPIKFSQAEDFDVTTMYSIEVTQRAISAEAYSYFRKIKEFNESNGSLFDKQQGTVLGNVVSVENPDEKVLGYFEVSGTSSKRVFLQLSDLDPQVLDHIIYPCTVFHIKEFEGDLRDFYNATDVDESIRHQETVLRSFYEIFDQFGRWHLAHRHCVDCRYRGSLGKPDYWP
ncbi:uncharacterized protein DUF4249 [Roseivirga pacifica]|uniref:DUF4249 domain-containing protein n=2 Tax=Roseivirga pacifica TaxID=1267423 RepID=A0A1I0QRI4_9BACT|nr:uncharacterized protein DUF4249 [Roseivirga pacifica]SEW29978.1 protein of unknown function [Roseivirga pacifica]